MRILSKLTLAMAAGTALMAALPAASAWAADELTITSWGGAYQESQRKAFFEPFVKDGNKVTEEEYNGEIAKLRAMVESKAVTWDVVDIDTQTALAACAEGVLETIDWGKLGLDKAKFIGGDLQDCAVPNIVYATIIAYDTSKMPDGPKTIADVFDLQKFPGKRGLQKSPFVNLEWALIADGVPQADVYKMLATPEGVDRAFKKLDEIKPHITVWWTSGAQSAQLVKDGEVDLIGIWSNRMQAVIDDGAEAQYTYQGGLLIPDCFFIPKGSTKVDLAMKAIAVAASPEIHANIAQYIPISPVSSEAFNTGKIPPERAKLLPASPENLKVQVWTDGDWWAEHGAEVQERWSNFIQE